VKRYYSRLTATAWDVFERETGKVHLTEQITYLFTDNGKVNDPETVETLQLIFYNSFSVLKFT
jgi:hypothetical protein